MSDPVWRKRVNRSLDKLGEIEEATHMLSIIVKADEASITSLKDRVLALEVLFKSQKGPLKTATPRKARKRPKKASSSPRCV